MLVRVCGHGRFSVSPLISSKSHLRFTYKQIRQAHAQHTHTVTNLQIQVFNRVVFQF